MLPREAERRAAKEKEIDLLREEIVGKHKKCKGTGFLQETSFSEGFPKVKVRACSCRKKFELVSRFILSNVPYFILLNQQIYTKLVFDPISGISLELRSSVISPLVRNLLKFARRPFGLLFLGKNGTGKTFIGLKILYYGILSGLTAHYIEFQDFLKLSRKIFDSGQEAERIFEEIIGVDLLLIDEIGSESKRSEHGISELKSCIKKRTMVGKPTLLISNYSYDEFSEVYGASIENMVAHHAKVFDFSKAIDVRKMKCSAGMEGFFKEIKKKRKKRKKA